MFGVVPDKVTPQKASGHHRNDSNVEARSRFRLMRTLPTDAMYIKACKFVGNLLLTPMLLMYWSVVIYVYPCLVNLLGSCCCRMLFAMNLTKWWLLHRDHAFSCTNENAGSTQVSWVRLQDMDTGNHNNNSSKGAKNTSNPKLFQDINPCDLAQGQLGDCWLIAALATLAEKPSFILNAFITRSYNPRGKYSLRLFDDKIQKFRIITIDDYIPCHFNTQTPIYSSVKGGKHILWPLLLEKGFAKMYGGYGKLKGGNPLTAMKAITGCGGETVIIEAKSSDESTKLFRKLRNCMLRNCLLACGSLGKDDGSGGTDKNTDSGIVKGHAYSVLGIYEPKLTTETVRLVKLRNPWGSFEWKGDWGDGSKQWLLYPGVALEIGKPANVDDGVFYMPWDAFIKHFHYVNILYLGTSIRQRHIHLHEEYADEQHCGLLGCCGKYLCGPCCGPIVGCTCGICWLWCGCQGCWSLWREESSSELRGELCV
jgi:hypothetical protein